MTREQAIKWLKTFRGRYGMNELEDAVEMAIKALESKDVIDKIRAEIYRKAHSGQWSDATMYGMLKAVTIIDEYKTESEEV